MLLGYKPRGRSRSGLIRSRGRMIRLSPTNTVSFWISTSQHNFESVMQEQPRNTVAVFAWRKEGQISIFVQNIQRKSDGSLPRMKPGQQRQVNALIREFCCNFDHGDCILFDDTCPQIISGSLCCKWFRWAVLPQNAVLENSLTGAANSKRCAECGRPFIPKSNRAKYCGYCAPVVHRRQKTESERRRRSGVDN